MNIYIYLNNSYQVINMSLYVNSKNDHFGGAIFGLCFASYVNGRIGRSEINSFSARNASGRSAKCGASSCRRDWRGRWGVDLVSPELIWVGCLFLDFFPRQVLDPLLGSWFYAFLFLWFSAFLLLCFSAYIASLLFLLLCFSASLLFCVLLFLLLCFSASVFPASLLLYFCAFLPLLFYFFFSSVMCFCCSTSCSFASLLPVFTVSLFFISFALFCSVCILNEP